MKVARGAARTQAAQSTVEGLLDAFLESLRTQAELLDLQSSVGGGARQLEGGTSAAAWWPLFCWSGSLLLSSIGTSALWWHLTGSSMPPWPRLPRPQQPQAVQSNSAIGSSTCKTAPGGVVLCRCRVRHRSWVNARQAGVCRVLRRRRQRQRREA